MLTGIDISHYQSGFDVSGVKPGFVIAKATENMSFVDRCCDGFVQQAAASGIPWGFYHYAKTKNPEAECDWFMRNTEGYDKKGIPVLDYEENLGSDFVGRFVQRYHDARSVWPWVYMNNSFIQRGMFTPGYRDKCGLWIARYPIVCTSYPDQKIYPYDLPGYTVVCWQFTDRLRFGGMNVDGDIAYVTKEGWQKYANPDGASGSAAPSSAVPTGSKWRLARDVISGDYGDGVERRNKLGSRYDEIQSCVNTLIDGAVSELAKAVIAGELGNGEERRYILGSRYAAVQKRVNQMM